MKIKHLMIAGCLFTAFTLQSCIKEKDLYQAPPTTYSELNLQLDGDYLSTELPMARATTPTKINESETLVGIAITMTPKEGQNPSSQKVRNRYGREADSKGSSCKEECEKTRTKKNGE